MNRENIHVVTERPEHFEAMGWKVFADAYESLQEIDQHDEIEFDLETTGLNSFIKEKVNSHQIGIPGKQFVFDTPTVPLILCKPILETKRIYGHNLTFDIPYCFKEGIVPMKITDTMINEWCLTMGLLPIPGRERSLEGCLWRYLGVKIDKTQQKTINLGLNSVEDILYAGRDVIHVKDLDEAQRKTMAARQLEKFCAFQNRYIPAHCYLEYSGVRVDVEALDRWIRDCEADEVIALRRLKEQFGDINWASSQQVGEILKEHGIEHINTETGNLETNQDILDKYDLPIATELSKYREAAKMVSTYGRKWYSYILPDGRIHTKYKPMVDTGRTACGEVDRRRYDPWNLNYTSEKPYPNMQNPPKKRKGFRDVFVPKNGNVLIVCDYSGQESVILADQAAALMENWEEAAMARLLGVEHRDPHSYVARLAFPETAELSDEEVKERHSDKRDVCKTAAFAIAYGGNWRTIMDNLNCTEELATHIYDSYMAAFPELKGFFTHCYDFAWRRGYMPTDWVFGGKRFFDRAREYREWKNKSDYWRRYYREKEEETEWYMEQKEKMKWYNTITSSLRKESINTRIQGTGAVMSKLAMIYFFDWIMENKLFGKVLIPIFVHDEIVAECHKKSADKVAAALQECMEKAGKVCLKHLTIKAEPKICLKWEK